MIRDHSGCEEDEAEACASMEILLNIGIAACITFDGTNYPLRRTARYYDLLP